MPDQNSQTSTEQGTDSGAFNPFQTETTTEAQTETTTKAADTQTETTQETVNLNLDGEDYNLNDLTTFKEKFPEGKVPITIGAERYEFDLNNPDDVEALKRYAGGEELKFSEEGTLETDNVWEFKINDEIEKVDPTTAEGKEQIKKYYQQGRYLETEIQKLNQQKTELSNNSNVLNVLNQSLEYNYLRNNGSELLAEPLLVELSDENGTVKRDEKGNPLNVVYNNVEDYTKAKGQYNKNKELIGAYKAAYSQSIQKYNTTISNFLSKHKDVTDLDKFLNENVNPYVAPFTTAGAVPVPDDFFEMIHYWKNRVQNEETIRKEERLKKAQPVKRKIFSAKIDTPVASANFGEMPNHKPIQLIKN